MAIGTVILVITPISWILLHQPQSNEADASVPYVTRDDDTYIKTSTKPVVATPSATTPGSTPSGTPTSATPTPTDTPSTPGQTPSTTPTDGPSTTPTSGPTDGPTAGPTDGPSTQTPQVPPNSQQPTNTPSSTPSSTPSTSTPPPPTDDGDMSGEEVELFSLVDNQRVENGCAPLRRNSSLSGGAGAEADDRAESNSYSSGSSKASTGGKDMTAKTAFSRLMDNSSGTLLDCGLRELGVGRGDAKFCNALICLGSVGQATRYAWVVDFK
ncbi:hypothetical protein G3I17_07910 [Streptomyces sp. SID13031]|nr:hypothetical protein [Streptomyces sp. SID13031]